MAGTSRAPRAARAGEGLAAVGLERVEGPVGVGSVGGEGFAPLGGVPGAAVAAQVQGA